MIMWPYRAAKTNKADAGDFQTVGYNVDDTVGRSSVVEAYPARPTCIERVASSRAPL